MREERAGSEATADGRQESNDQPDAALYRFPFRLYPARLYEPLSLRLPQSSGQGVQLSARRRVEISQPDLMAFIRPDRPSCGSGARPLFAVVCTRRGRAFLADPGAGGSGAYDPAGTIP